MGVITSIYIPMMHKDLNLRGHTFYAHETDYRGRETMVGVNALLKILKNHEHPNFSNDASHTEEHINTMECFPPRFFTATDWHVDNVAYSIFFSLFWDYARN